jgi:hypothetical protein
MEPQGRWSGHYDVSRKRGCGCEIIGDVLLPSEIKMFDCRIHVPKVLCLKRNDSRHRGIPSPLTQSRYTRHTHQTAPGSKEANLHLAEILIPRINCRHPHITTRHIPHKLESATMGRSPRASRELGHFGGAAAKAQTPCPRREMVARILTRLGFQREFSADGIQ